MWLAVHFESHSIKTLTKTSSPPAHRYHTGLLHRHVLLHDLHLPADLPAQRLEILQTGLSGGSERSDELVKVDGSMLTVHDCDQFKHSEWKNHP